MRQSSQAELKCRICLRYCRGGFIRNTLCIEVNRSGVAICFSIVFSILQGNRFAFYKPHQQQDPPCPHNPVHAAGKWPSGGSAGREVSVEAVLLPCSAHGCVNSET